MDKHQVQYENECFYLGAILKDQTLLDESTLTKRDFHDDKNKKLFGEMVAMRDKGEEISLVTLSHLPDSKTMAFGGMLKLKDLIKGLPSVHAFKTYENNIKSFNAIDNAQYIVYDFLTNTKEVNDVKELSKLIENINKLEHQTVKKQESFKELLVKRVEEHQETPADGLSGIDTGFKSLNRYTDGWQKSDLIIVAARPSLGKTALVLDSGKKSSKSNTMFTFFSIEMVKALVVDRMIASEGKINLMKMRNPNKTFNPDDWERYWNSIGYLENLPVDIRDENTVPEIRAAIRKNIRENQDKDHLIAIDFLTLIQPTTPSGNTHVDVTAIIRDLKSIAKELNVPIIVIAQLNRGVENRQDKRPSKADLAESGTIEQIADVIAFLYRDDYYDQESENEGIIEVIFSKNRNGMTGTVEMAFDKKTNSFYDLDRKFEG